MTNSKLSLPKNKRQGTIFHSFYEIRISLVPNKRQKTVQKRRKKKKQKKKTIEQQT